MIHSNNVNNNKWYYNDGYQMECHTGYENEEDYSYNSKHISQKRNVLKKILWFIWKWLFQWKWKQRQL